MDTLMTHRFWLCFGVAVVLIPVGWWMGSSSLAKEITQNKGEIEAAESGIPKGADHPNKDWIAGVAKVVEKRKEYHAEHAAELWDMQRSVMTWPSSVKPAMQGAKFFGPGNNEHARTTYNTVYYLDTLERLYRIVDPIGRNGNETLLGYDPEQRKVTGKVVFPYEALPKVPLELWKAKDPEWREMWDAQLDAWLTEALLTSIKRVNDRRGAKNVFDASIREIVTLILRGGSKGDAAAATAGATGETTSEDSTSMQMDTPTGAKSFGGPMGDGADGSGGLGATGGPLALNFLDEIFGKEVPREGAAGAATDGASTDAQEATGAVAMTAPAGATMSRSGVGSGMRSNMSPYVDNDPEMPFKTRGFVLQVLMNRKDIPLLVQELTDANKSKFPVEILMIQEVDRDVDHTGLAIHSRVGGGFNGEFDGGLNRGDMDEGVPRSPFGGSPMPAFGGGRPVVPMGGRLGGVRPLGGGVSPLGGGVNPMDDGAGAMQSTTTNGPWTSALNDPGLGYVVIAGLMTIYQPPKEPLKKSDAKTGAPSKPTATKPADGNIPVSPKPGPKVDTNTPDPGKAESKSAAKGNAAPTGIPPKQPAVKSGKPVPGPKAGIPKPEPSAPGSASKVEPKTKSPAGVKKATPPGKP